MSTHPPRPHGPRPVKPGPADGSGAVRPGPAGPGTAGAFRPPPRRPAVRETRAAAPAKPGRDRYLDTLRAVALVRVVVFHIFGWGWLTILFPSMGVMFALAGSLMARSLSQRGSWRVIRGRLRRLLPPMWVFGLIVLPLIFWTGWDAHNGEGVWGLVKLVDWVFPVGAPPYPNPAHTAGVLDDPTWADQAAGPLWYIRAYLWFVLASPLLLWLFRRAPWAAVGLPVALCAVLTTGLVTVPGETGAALTDFATYGACWVLGFAHHEGMFRKVPRYLTVSLATLVMALGLWWATGHIGDAGWNFDEIPLTQALWSLGFVAVLLQYSPSWQKLPGRLAQFDSVITLANNRAVTIYLWHNLLIMLTFPVIDLLWNVPGIGHVSSQLNAAYSTLSLILVWPLIGLVILALGWFEDLAAKRRPRLWPNGTKERRAEALAAAPPAGPPAVPAGQGAGAAPAQGG